MERAFPAPSHFVKVKVKVKVGHVFFTESHAMKAYCGVEVLLHAFFGLETRWR
jgi:hypothetical protein